MQLLQSFGINLPLFIAQIVNFGLVVGVLTWLVYKPLLKVIDERREAARKAALVAEEAVRQQQEMDQLKLEQLRKLDEESGKFMESAKRHAETIRTELTDKAHREAEAILDRGRKQLAQERQEALDSLQGTLSSVVMRMTEKILEREFGPADQKRILEGVQKDIPALLQS